MLLVKEIIDGFSSYALVGNLVIKLVLLTCYLILNYINNILCEKILFTLSAYISLLVHVNRHENKS